MFEQSIFLIINFGKWANRTIYLIIGVEKIMVVYSARQKKNLVSISLIEMLFSIKYVIFWLMIVYEIEKNYSIEL